MYLTLTTIVKVETGMAEMIYLSVDDSKKN
jgi:hypothetical protein